MEGNQPQKTMNLSNARRCTDFPSKMSSFAGCYKWKLRSNSVRHQTQLQQPGRASAHMRCCQIAANADLFPRSRHSTAPAATKTTRGDSERKPCRLTTHPIFHTKMGGALHMEQDMPFIPSKFTVTIISIHKSINNDGALQSKHKSFP